MPKEATDKKKKEKKVLDKIKMTQKQLEENVIKTAQIQKKMEENQIKLEKEIADVKRTDKKLMDLKNRVKNHEKY